MSYNTLYTYSLILTWGVVGGGDRHNKYCIPQPPTPPTPSQKIDTSSVQHYCMRTPLSLMGVLHIWADCYNYIMPYHLSVSYLFSFILSSLGNILSRLSSGEREGERCFRCGDLDLERSRRLRIGETDLLLLLFFRFFFSLPAMLD